MNFQLRPGETVLFEGDVTLFKSKFGVVQTDAVVTDQRLMVVEGQQVHDAAAIISVTEEKHGFGKKMVLNLRSGGAITMTAPNHAVFKTAVMVLVGQATVDSMPTAPKLVQVKNGTAWLAAFGPLIAGVILIFLAPALWGTPELWGYGVLLQLFVVRVALIYLFLRIDYLNLQGQGYNVKQLGLADPITFPVYLFSRAKVFQNGKGPAITWTVLVVIDILLILVV
jgi:hypothetical protein